MPLHFTEYVRERLRYRGDATTARFLDLFHHRLLALFYRAWAQAQPTVQHDRPQEDRFAAWLGSTCGLGKESQEARLVDQRPAETPAVGARSFSGLVVAGPSFHVPVAIEPHIVQWLLHETTAPARFARAGPEAPSGAGQFG
jgi:type VI secretion system protein ImpH